MAGQITDAVCRRRRPPMFFRRFILSSAARHYAILLYFRLPIVAFDIFTFSPFSRLIIFRRH